MFGKFFGNKKNKDESNKYDGEIIDVLDQLKSELNETNLNLRKELHYMTNYFNKIPISYAIINYEGSIIRANKSLIRMLSCVKTECIGSKIDKYMHPDDIKLFYDFMNQIKENKLCGESVIIRLMTDKGNVNFIKWGAVNLEDDQVVMLFGQDITHEIELGDRLKKFITKKYNILNNYPGAILATNLKGTIKEFNKSAEISSEYSSDEVIDKKHIFDLFPNKNLLKDENMNTIQKVDLKKSSGKTEKIYILLLPLMNEKKVETGYIGIWHSEEYIDNIRSIK